MLRKTLCLFGALMICVSGALFAGCGGEVDNRTEGPPEGVKADPNATLEKSSSAEAPVMEAPK